MARKIKEKQVLLKKENDVILFIREKQGIRLVNLDLSKHIILNEPIRRRHN